jgi:hypothetical protein
VYENFLSPKSLKPTDTHEPTISSKPKNLDNSLFKSLQPNSIGFKSGEYGGR